MHHEKFAGFGRNGGVFMNTANRILAEISKLITYCFAASTAVLYMVIRCSYDMPVSWEGSVC